MAWAGTLSSTRCGSGSACQATATELLLLSCLSVSQSASQSVILEMLSLPGQAVEDQVCRAVDVMAVALGLHTVERCSSRGHCSPLLTGEGGGRHPRCVIGGETNEQSPVGSSVQVGHSTQQEPWWHLAGAINPASGGPGQVSGIKSLTAV
jgi:hypothetical protein